MKILAYDKFPDASTGLNYVQLPELFAQADILSLHCPLTEETNHLICDRTLQQMKDGVVIVNTSRVISNRSLEVVRQMSGATD